MIQEETNSPYLNRGQPPKFQTDQIVLGRYRIAGELGQGGMGVVYRCYDKVGGIDVALKALPPELSRSVAEMDEVRENFRLIEKLHHPSIANIKTIEHDVVTGGFYLVMECVEGTNLWQYRKKLGGTVALEYVVPIARQVAQALDYAHGHRIIHRDIKPHNIMVGPQVPGHNFPSVKLLDFGIAAQICTSMTRMSRGKWGASGTAPYMAPEQWRGEFQDATTDQYALAVVVYELLAGHVPFDAPDMDIMKKAVLENEAQPPAGLDARIWTVLKKALSKDRKSRYSSCEEFVDSLEVGRVTRRPVTGEPHATVRDMRRRRWRTLSRWAVAAAVVLLLAGGYAGVAAWRRHQAAEQVALEELTPIKSAVEQRWGRVRELKSTIGLRERVDRADVDIRTGEAFFKRGNYARALDFYRRAVGECQDVERIEGLRVMAAGARDASQVERDAAKKQRADVFATDLWLRAQRLDASAASAYDRTDFEPARRIWADAATEYQGAADYARGMELIRQARTRFSDQLGGLDRSLLSTNGVSALVRAEEEARIAAGLAEEQKWGLALEHWSMGQALLKTVERQVAMERNRRLFDATLLDASNLVAREEYEKARVLAVGALTMKGGNTNQVALLLERIRSATAPQRGENIKIPDLGIEMVWIPAMKAWVSRHEVTNAQFRKFRPAHDSGSYKGYNLNADNQPAVFVSYDDVMAFITWLNDREKTGNRLPDRAAYRLPDGDEWTTFAECGRDLRYPWGDDWPPTSGNYDDEADIDPSRISGYNDGSVVTCPVELSGENPWGLYGVGGNVLEWTCEADDAVRMLRGGSWLNSSRDLLRSRGRYGADPSGSSSSVGFRLLLADTKP